MFRITDGNEMRVRGCIYSQKPSSRLKIDEFFLEVILTAADRNSEIMQARFPPDSRIFRRFWIDILMNNDRKYTYDFERALHENMNYVLIGPDPRASMRHNALTDSKLTTERTVRIELIRRCAAH